MRRILIIDDEKDMCLVLKLLLEKDGYSIITENDSRQAIQHLLKGDVIDLIISDLMMPDIDGMGILNFLKETKREIPIILITAYGSIPTAVEAMKQGAADFITKPFNKDVIRHIVRRILHMDTLENENKLLKDSVHEGELVYRSRTIQQIMETVKKLAAVSTPVLITGESGTGKGLIARSIHRLSQKKTYVRINCPAIPETLLESELFGYQKGAFTGAVKDYKGKVRLAEEGTLFLDEVADLSLKIQPKLLRLLEEKSFEPLGSTTTVKVNTRIICATNRNLKDLISQGLFREDLFYRINAFTINIPPLRERKEDTLPLVDFMCKKISKEIGKDIKGISEEVKKAFMAYQWPGNVRELRNVVERAIVLANEDIITLSDLPLELQGVGIEVPVNGGNRLVYTEKKLLLDSLHKYKWNISTTARELGISRSTLRYRISKYKLKHF